jgi:hypothetical protein
VTRNSSNKAGRQKHREDTLIPLASFAATAEFAPSDPVSVATQFGPGGRNDAFGRALIWAMERETQQRQPPRSTRSALASPIGHKS